MVRKVNTASEVIDALGGNTAVAEITGVKPNAVGNWRVKGLATNTYRILKEELKRRGLDAPDSLWRMK